MIKIAICDDNIELTSQMEGYITEYTSKHHISAECDVFFDGSTLINSIKTGDIYDLVYLDIEMNHMNGMKTAQCIRDMALPSLIIYVSNHEKYLKDLFDTEPFRFISKPVNEYLFYDTLKAAIKKINDKSGFFSFKYNRTLTKLPFNRILYFQSDNRIIHICTSTDHITSKVSSPILQDTYQFYGKLKEVESEIKKHTNRFLRINRSYLVNFDYIKSINYTTVTLFTGKVLMISDDRQNTVRDQFCSLLHFENN